MSLPSHILIFPVPFPRNAVFPHNSTVIIFNFVLIILVDSRACNCHATSVEVRRKLIRGDFLFPSSCGVQESIQVMKCVNKGPFYLLRHCWPRFRLFILLHKSITLLVIQIRLYCIYFYVCLHSLSYECRYMNARNYKWPQRDNLRHWFSLSAMLETVFLCHLFLCAKNCLAHKRPGLLRLGFPTWYRSTVLQMYT